MWLAICVAITSHYIASGTSSSNSDRSSVVSLERNANTGERTLVAIPPSQIDTEPKMVMPLTSEPTQDITTSVIRNNPEILDTKEETITEKDTSATLTANINANNLELVFDMPQQTQSSMEDTASSIDASIPSESCDGDDHVQNDQQSKQEDSYQITAPTEVEDRSSMHRIDNSPLPALNAIDNLCTGIGKCIHVFGIYNLIIL